MNSIWNKNIESFKNRFPSLFDLYNNQIDFITQKFNATDVFSDSELILLMSEIFPFWKTERAKDGEWTCTENGLRLHSAYRPGSAQVSFSEGEESEKSDSKVYVFLGCGIGYEFINFCRTKPDGGILFLEPEAGHFFSALCLTDWTSVFDINKLSIVLGNFDLQERNKKDVQTSYSIITQIIPLCEKLADLSDKTSTYEIKYILNPAFVKHDEDFFLSVKNLLDRNISKNQINRNTLKKFGKLWERNARMNSKNVSLCDGVNSYKNFCSEKPWVLLAAGPSLEKILPVLPDLKKKSILICVDTALRAVLKTGVEPDFIVLTDPQFWAYMHIAGLKSPSSILIADAVSYPAVFRFQCKKIIISSSPFPISEKYRKIFEGKGELESGGSVATVAWSFAVMAGAKKIYMAGLDLSFPKKQTHIKGSTFEQAVHRTSTKKMSSELRTCDVLFAADVSLAKDYFGNDVLTDSRMKMFAWWFESKIASTPGVKTFTLCPESMVIPGISVGDFFKEEF